MSGSVVKGRCANHKCTRKATAQGSRMTASLRMDGALQSAGGDFSFSGAELLPEPHSTARTDPLRVRACFQLRNAPPPGSHHRFMSASAAQREGPMRGEKPVAVHYGSWSSSSDVRSQTPADFFVFYLIAAQLKPCNLHWYIIPAI